MSSILSVSQLNKYLSFKIKSDVKLKGVCVKGDISNFSVNYKSGHAYFTVKDEQSCIKAVMFSSNLSRLKTLPQDGMCVLVTGNIEVYEPAGVYQIIAVDIMPLGSGLLHAQIELIKEKLRKQGVFDESIKKPIPLFPKKIAVVSSLTGAALQDILSVIQRRFPICTVEIYHTQVQGEQAADNIRASLEQADKNGNDTIILARGGGSLEDLMPFNTETAVLAVYNCITPVITAVGHETDTTLVDYAADMRAPTPSAAAELATPDKATLYAAVDKLSDSLEAAMNSRLTKLSDSLEDAMSAKLESLSFSLSCNDSTLRFCIPISKLERDFQRLADTQVRLRESANKMLTGLDDRLEKYADALTSLSPLSVLNRGYAVVSRKGSVITDANDLNESDEITVRFANSSVKAVVTNISRKDEINEL